MNTRIDERTTLKGSYKEGSTKRWTRFESNCGSCKHNKLARVVKLLACILQVSDSNLDQNTDHPVLLSDSSRIVLGHHLILGYNCFLSHIF
jgi:hypothetical protein